MSDTLFVKREGLVGALRRALPPVPEEQAVEFERKMLEWMRRQPALPKLVGTTAAAQILGIRAPHMARYEDRLPSKVKVDGGHDVYLRADVEALARVLGAEREARAQARRKGREEQ